MEAGRELDALVAEEVMGEVEAHAPVGDGLTRTDVFGAPSLLAADDKIRVAYPKSLAAGRLWPAQYCGPKYSTDLAAAWEVVEKMRERYVDFLLEWDHDQWRASYCGENEDARADTVALAICLAALRAVGVEVD